MASPPKIAARATPYGIHLSCSEWTDLTFGPLVANVSVDGQAHVLKPEGSPVERIASGGNEGFKVRLAASGAPVEMLQSWKPVDAGWHVSSRLRVTTGAAVTLENVELLALSSGLSLTFGSSASRLRLLEQGQYWGRIEPMFRAAGDAESASELVWVMANEDTGHAFLVGYETARRWAGRIRTRRTHNGTLAEWAIGFDGGDLLLDLDETVELEDVLLLAGADPLDLLEAYGERVRDRHTPGILSQPPVSWCSWYPYRLGVSTARVRANARVGAERLRSLGLSIIEVDLGWEDRYLPSVFEENEQFPDGLRGLADELEELGFVMGVWAAPTSVSEHDALAVEHPEWLVHNADGTLHDSGQWFWEPHGSVHILDLTHPGAQKWLHDRIRSLADRGARYLKADFVGNLRSGAAKRRHDRRIVAGGGLETGHLAIRIMREAMREVAPGSLFLDCGGPELPGPSEAGLLYTCDDTGNTGYVGWHHLQRVFLATATHLFKNRRWGIIQPSCLCVGLPGTLAEARVRATAAFMAGGQIDISDDLMTLPEDRWQVLTATLPPLGISARPIDLFRPIRRTSGGYSTSTQSTNLTQAEMPAAPPASVWVLPVRGEWDTWTLVAVFSYDEPQQEGERRESQLQTYFLPLERLGLSPEDDLWAYEFWSGQFCGCMPADPPPPPKYSHPGDLQMPLGRPQAEVLTVSFFGPGVMLFALRPRLAHPWVVGTSFHQSCGRELADVRWNAGRKTLSGVLARPAGQCGTLTLAGFGRASVRATVSSKRVPARSGARGSLIIPITTRSEHTRWEVREE